MRWGACRARRIYETRGGWERGAQPAGDGGAACGAPFGPARAHATAPCAASRRRSCCLAPPRPPPSASPLPRSQPAELRSRRARGATRRQGARAAAKRVRRAGPRVHAAIRARVHVLYGGRRRAACVARPPACGENTRLWRDHPPVARPPACGETTRLSRAARPPASSSPLQDPGRCSAQPQQSRGGGLALLVSQLPFFPPPRQARSRAGAIMLQPCEPWHIYAHGNGFGRSAG
jgi:hypothetical protein